MSVDWYERLLRHPRLLPAAKRSAKGGSQIMAVLEQLRITERLTPDELALQQMALLQALVEHAAASSTHFAARLQAAALTPPDLTQPGGLARLAPLTRRALVDAGEGLFCRSTPGAHGQVAATSTSGSTGEPVTVRRTQLCQLHWFAQTLREHLWHGRDFAARLAVVRANITVFSQLPSWGPPCDDVFRTGPALVLPVSSPVEQIWRRFVEFKPGYLLILPSVLDSLLDLLDRGGGARLENVRGIRTLSETVPTRLRAKAQRLLGCDINDAYSSQEGGVMAMQCPEEGSYHVAETMIMEIIDANGDPCAPGETGRILITDLLNFATPLIRYEIGDYAEVGHPCPCGRGLPVVRRFVGRQRNLVLLPDGSRHWPVVGFHRWQEVCPIRQFQFTQLDRDTVEAALAVEVQPTAAQQTRLTEIIRQELGHPFEIRYRWQTQPLARGPGGKFEEFVCLAE
jgi:phenylacetate-CoA ligase